MPTLRLARALRAAVVLAAISAALGAPAPGWSADPPVPPADASGPSEIQLTVDAASDAGTQNGQRLGFLTGRALAYTGSLEQSDVLFLMDISGSTSASSGVDVNGDGKLGGGLFGLGGGRADSVLAAEAAALEKLLATFDPRTTRAGLITFSGGEERGADDAFLQVPLTSQFGRVREGLSDVLLAAPSGGTNIAGGLRLALLEISGGRQAESKGRRAQKHVVLLTDGVPDVAYESRREAEDRAIRIAERMARAGIRVHCFALGRDATREPRAAVEIAARSGGTFNAVQDLNALPQLITSLDLTSIQSVSVRHLDLGVEARQLERGRDGIWSALLPVRDGPNRVEVYARATDGSERRLLQTLVFDRRSLDLRQEQARARLGELELRTTPERDRDRDVQVDVEPGTPEP